MPAALDLVIEEPSSGFCGAVVGCAADAVHLEDRHGRIRVFPLTMTFVLEGHPVRLTRPRPVRPDPRTLRSASGSTVRSDHRATVALASRIYVEGIHDAELVEKGWGHDLRIEGVVVEPPHGIDDLPTVVADFAPARDRRLGVLVGHPHVDIWQAVRPEVLGIRAWPAVPRGRPWKDGVCARLGWGPDTGAAWQQILGRVSSYSDLDPALLARVEELIDFVTAQG